MRMRLCWVVGMTWRKFSSFSGMPYLQFLHCTLSTKPIHFPMYQSLLLVLHIPLVHTHPHTTQPMGQRYRYKMSRLLSIYYPPCHWEFVPNREGGKPIVDRIVRPSELIRMISPWFPDCGIWRLFGWIFALDSSWSWIVVPVPVHVLIPIRGQDREWYLVWQWIVSMSLTDYSHRFS